MNQERDKKKGINLFKKKMKQKEKFKLKRCWQKKRKKVNIRKERKTDQKRSRKMSFLRCGMKKTRKQEKSSHTERRQVDVKQDELQIHHFSCCQLCSNTHSSSRKIKLSFWTFSFSSKNLNILWFSQGPFYKSSSFFCSKKSLKNLSACWIYFSNLFLYQLCFVFLRIFFGKKRRRLDATDVPRTRSVTTERTGRCSRELSIEEAIRDAWEKWFSWETKVIFFFPNLFRKIFSKKSCIDGVDGAETETKVTKTLLLFVHPKHVKVSWQRGDTLPPTTSTPQYWRSFHIPAPTLESSTARRNAKMVRSPVVKGATSECMTALDMPSLDSSVWESTTTAVTASVPK